MESLTWPVYFVGSGGSGKTTVIKKISGVSLEVQSSVGVTVWKQGDRVLDLWELSGDQIYQACLQPFIAAGSIFIAIVDARKMEYYKLKPLIDFLSHQDGVFYPMFTFVDLASPFDVDEAANTFRKMFLRYVEDCKEEIWNEAKYFHHPEEIGTVNVISSLIRSNPIFAKYLQNPTRCLFTGEDARGMQSRLYALAEDWYSFTVPPTNAAERLLSTPFLKDFKEFDSGGVDVCTLARFICTLHIRGHFNLRLNGATFWPDKKKRPEPRHAAKILDEIPQRGIIRECCFPLLWKGPPVSEDFFFRTVEVLKLHGFMWDTHAYNLQDGWKLDAFPELSSHRSYCLPLLQKLPEASPQLNWTEFLLEGDLQVVWTHIFLGSMPESFFVQFGCHLLNTNRSHSSYYYLWKRGLLLVFKQCKVHIRWSKSCICFAARCNTEEVTSGITHIWLRYCVLFQNLSKFIQQWPIQVPFRVHIEAKSKEHIRNSDSSVISGMSEDIIRQLRQEKVNVHLQRAIPLAVQGNDTNFSKLLSQFYDAEKRLLIADEEEVEYTTTRSVAVQSMQTTKRHSRRIQWNLNAMEITWTDRNTKETASYIESNLDSSSNKKSMEQVQVSLLIDFDEAVNQRICFQSETTDENNEETNSTDLGSVNEPTTSQKLEIASVTEAPDKKNSVIVSEEYLTKFASTFTSCIVIEAVAIYLQDLQKELRDFLSGQTAEQVQFLAVLQQCSRGIREGNILICLEGLRGMTQMKTATINRLAQRRGSKLCVVL